MKMVIEAQCRKYLTLDANTASKLVDVDAQRQRDHLGHYVLRLAFCRSWVPRICSLHGRAHSSAREELRRRFVKTETMLFRIRYEAADQSELAQFLESKKFAWERVRLPRARPAPRSYPLPGVDRGAAGPQAGVVARAPEASVA